MSAQTLVFDFCCVLLNLKSILVFKMTHAKYSLWSSKVFPTVYNAGVAEVCSNGRPRLLDRIQLREIKGGILMGEKGLNESEGCTQQERVDGLKTKPSIFSSSHHQVISYLLTVEDLMLAAARYSAGD